MKKCLVILLRCAPIGILIATILGVVIMWGDFKLTHRPFLEIRPSGFNHHPQWQGEDESQVWSYLSFVIVNHGKTPAYDVKVDKLDIVLDREIDLVKDVATEVEHLSVFPNTIVTKTVTVTNSKADTQKIIRGEKSITYDIKIKYRGVKPIKEKNYYWYTFQGKFDKGQIIVTNTDGN